MLDLITVGYVLVLVDRTVLCSSSPTRGVSQSGLIAVLASCRFTIVWKLSKAEILFSVISPG